MSQEWFVRRGEQERGPLSPEELKRLVTKGTIVASDLLRTADTQKWREAGSVKGLFESESVSGPNSASSRNGNETPKRKTVPPPLPMPPSAIQPSSTSSPDNKKVPVWQRLSLAALMTVLCFPIGLLLVWLNPRMSRLVKVGWIGGFAVFVIGMMFIAQSSTKTAREGQANNAAESRVSADGSTPSETTDPNLPLEITQKKSPELALAKMPLRLAQDAYGRNHAFFSPNGSFVVVIENNQDKSNIRLWHTATGEEHSAKAPDCDYFSIPASFSPDESRLACLDGDFLRVWNLKTSPASLMQTLRLSKSNQADEWNAVVWRKEDTLIVSVRPEHNFYSTHQRFRLKDNTFSLDGPIRSSPQKYNAEFVTHTSMALTPDGATLALAVRDRGRGHLVVQATEYESGKVIREVLFPSNEPSVERFPSTELLSKIEANHSYFMDKGAFAEFTPDGRFLLVATQSERNRGIKVIPAATWQNPVELDLSDFSPTGGDSKDRYMPRSFSKDGNSIAGLAIRKSKTSRGENSARVALVHDLVTGKRSTEIDLGDEFGASGGGEDERIDREKVSFSPDGESLVVAVSRSLGWNNQNKRAENSWSVGSWRLVDGKKNFAVSGLALGTYTPAVKLAPNGEVVVLSGGESLQVLDVKRLAKVRADCDEGDRLWAEGKHADALKFYCSVLSDDMAGLVCPNLTQVWSRCIDGFAERGETAKSRSVVIHLQQINIALEPETVKGKKIVDDLLAEQAKASRLAEQQARVAGEKRLSEVRAKNLKNRIVAGAMSKREFIEKLRATASRGQISNSVTNAIFEDFSFQDVFGEPDSNIEWVNRQRLFSYRCNDGAVQLTVVIIESRTFLSGVNQF